MHFIKQTADFDLGDTPIENIFINDFMPMANGTYVKVYLLGYKYAQDKDPSLSINHQTIAKHLNIPLSDVLNAWDFWEQKGVIKKHFETKEDTTQYTVEFLSLKQLYIDNNYTLAKITQEKEASSLDTYTCSPQDLVQANRIPEINEMFHHINQLLRRELVPNEKKKVLEWFYNYNMNTDVIIRAFMYCVQQKNMKGIRNVVRFVESIIRNWYDNGITNMEKLDTYLEKTDGRYLQYTQIFKALGFHFRQPSTSEKETMDRWLDEWKFSMDVILKACANSQKTSNPNINYINSILERWKKEGFTSVEDVKQKQTPPKPTPQKNGKATPNRFHNFEQRTAKYSKDELEKLFRDNK
ncbi:DnaD domain protein [Clostridiaceae bacterium 35-E11]